MTDLSRLEASLRTLRTEIATLEPGDDDARRRLAALVGELESALADPARSGERAPLGEQLKSSILRIGSRESSTRSSRASSTWASDGHGRARARQRRRPGVAVVGARKATSSSLTRAASSCCTQ